MCTLIFGGTGSLGTELTKYILSKNGYAIVASRDEAKHWELKNKFQNNKNIESHICDVRDVKRVKEVILETKPNQIIIAQALKQVDTCERFPEESIETNINGVKNILNVLKELALSGIYHPENVCFVSTDKSCNPINVYGMCKSISEKLTINTADLFQKNEIKTKFVVTRYGNVLSTKGSIIPLFIKQANDDKQKTFTVTHEDMTRFIMTLEESVELIFYAMENGKNGDMFVPHLHSMKIIDLADIFSELFNKKVSFVGIRPGEKMHEIMLNEEEARKAQKITNEKTNKEYYIVSRNPDRFNYTYKEFSSQDTVLTKDELREYIINFLKINQYI